MGRAIFDEKSVITTNLLVLPASGTGAITLVGTDVNDRRIDTILVSNRDGIAHVINLSLLVGAVVTQLGSVSVPAGQGYAGTPSIDLLAAVLPADQVGYPLVGGCQLHINMVVAVVATFDVSLSVIGGAM